MEYCFYIGANNLLHVALDGKTPDHLLLANSINKAISNGALARGEMLKLVPGG